MSGGGLGATARSVDEVVLELAEGAEVVRVLDGVGCDEPQPAQAKTKHTTLTPQPKRLEVRRHAPTGLSVTGQAPAPGRPARRAVQSADRDFGGESLGDRLPAEFEAIYAA